MPGNADDKRAWVERVLGLRLVAPGDDASDGPLLLRGRLESAANDVRALGHAQAPEAADLTARLGALITSAKRDPVQAASALDALERDIARATSAARGREAPMARGRGVVYRKLLLRWREAQSQFAANLTTLGDALLGRPEIQADPRIEDIKLAVAALPKLVPTFGGQLEDVLDAGMNATDPAELARLANEGIKAVDVYRQQLAAATHLMELQSFAANDLGTGIALHDALDAALLELKQQLAA